MTSSSWDIERKETKKKAKMFPRNSE